MDEFFCRLLLPKCLHSDQGSQFESEIIRQACRLLGIEKSRTTPYHPQSDGLIETFNRTLLQMLATCANTHPFEWEDHIHKVCMAYNTSIQSSTGYSPFFLMFGRKARLPILYDTPTDVSTLPVFVQNLQQALKDAFASARLNIGTHQERQQDSYNRRASGFPHQPGSLVWLFNPVVPKGRAKKFHKPWSGPFKVISRLSDNTYRIKNTRRPFKTKVVHFDRLKQCMPGTRLPQYPHNVQRWFTDSSNTTTATGD